MLSKLDRQQQISKLVISSLLSYLFQTIFVTRSLGTTCGRNLTRETPASHIAVTKTDNQDHHQLSLRLWTGTMESGEYAFMHYSPLSCLSHVPHFPLVTVVHPCWGAIMLFAYCGIQVLWFVEIDLSIQIIQSSCTFIFAVSLWCLLAPMIIVIR